MTEVKRGRRRSQTIVVEATTLDPWESELYTSKPAEETIKEVIKDFDVKQLTDSQKNYIGMCAGFKMWDILTSDEKRQAWITGTAKDYYSHSVFTPVGVPPLLCYKRVGKGFKNEYIINLNSMRATKSSIKQDPVPDTIIRHFLDKV